MLRTLIKLFKAYPYLVVFKKIRMFSLILCLMIEISILIQFNLQSPNQDTSVWIWKFSSSSFPYCDGRDILKNIFWLSFSRISFLFEYLFSIDWIFKLEGSKSVGGLRVGEHYGRGFYWPKLELVEYWNIFIIIEVYL